MTRENIMPNPSQKLFEAYLDFSGGLNSETGNETLKDNEFPQLDNVDLIHRGTAMRRTGRTLIATVPTGAQGLFTYSREGQSGPDLVIATAGQLYYILNGTTSPIQISITDIIPSPAVQNFTFQTTKRIGASQFGNVLYIATGTKLVQFGYDTSDAWVANTAYTVGETVLFNGNVYKCTVAGSTGSGGPSGAQTYGTTSVDGTVTWSYQWPQWFATTVLPYQPTSQEAIYIGLNALAPNPLGYITDTSGSPLQVSGIQSVSGNQYGIVGQPVQLQALIQKPSTVTSVTYTWEYSIAGAGSWTVGLTGNDSAAKIWTFTPPALNNYDIQITIKDNTSGVQDPVINTFTFPAFPVYQTQSQAPQTMPHEGIQNCRYIMRYWDSMLMWGDPDNPFQMYVSDITNPAYWPIYNTISFDIGRQEPITSCIEYRGSLIVFTTTSVQILTGQTTSTFERDIIHYTLGAVAENSAVNTGNTISFLSAEGVFALTPNPYLIEVMNISRIDYQIKSELVKDPNACALAFDSQLWLCIPSMNYVYRYYYEQGNVWVRDVSSKLHFVSMVQFGATVWNLSSDGNIYVLDDTTYTDDGEVYPMNVKSKLFDLGASFNWKKLKRVFFLAKNYAATSANLQVTVYADSAISLSNTTGQAVVNTDDAGISSVTWQANTALPSTPDPSTGWFEFMQNSTPGTWLMGYAPMGDTEVSVIYTHIRGKARRCRVQFIHEDDTPCEVFGFGIEFKEKKPY